MPLSAAEKRRHRARVGALVDFLLKLYRRWPQPAARAVSTTSEISA